MYTEHEIVAMVNIFAFLFGAFILGMTVASTYIALFSSKKNFSDEVVGWSWVIMIGGWFCIAMVLLKNM